MNNIGRTAVAFLTGLGIGAGFAALFAPRSGEETREWVAESAERRLRALRRVGRRSVRQLRDALPMAKKRSQRF
jgi:gas vesicle protein